MRNRVWGLSVENENKYSKNQYWQGVWQEEEQNHCQAHRKKILHLAIEGALSLPQRSALLLYYEEGLTMAEIGGLLGVNRSTICRNLGRARARLEKHLQYFY